MDKKFTPAFARILGSLLIGGSVIWTAGEIVGGLSDTLTVLQALKIGMTSITINPLTWFGLLLFLIAAYPSRAELRGAVVDCLKAVGFIKDDALALVLNAHTTMANSTCVTLDDVTITNQSNANMSLRFVLDFRFTRSDGQPGKTRVAGEWHATGTNTQSGRPLVSVGAQLPATGSLLFRFPNAANMGVSKWKIDPFKDCILEIKDDISGKTVGCEPAHGYPNGKIDLPSATS